jgi:pimeloyl-ACP methyl ester carboxylesterase
MPYIATEKAELYYEVHGESGPTVTFAHGGGGNTLEWFQQVPAFLAAGYRALLFDQRGWGRSACAVDDMRFDYFPTDALAVMDAAGVAQTAIVSHAIGGWTAMATAIAAPERIACIVMSASGGGILSEGILRAFREGPGKVVGERRKIQQVMTAPDFPERAPDLFFLMSQIGKLNQDVGAFMKRSLDPANGVTAARLEGYRVPTLVIGGSESRVIPPDVLRDASTYIPGAEFREIAGAGHAPPFEKAHAFNAMVLDYLGTHFPARA